MVAGDGGEVGALIRCQHLVGRDVGQLHLGIAVRQHIQGVVVVHAALAGVPLKDDLLEGLEGEGPVDPALADGIAEGLQVALAHEVPERHAIPIGDGEAVVGIAGIAAGDGEETAVVEGDALALQRRRRRPTGQRGSGGDGNHRQNRAQPSPKVMQTHARHDAPQGAADSPPRAGTARRSSRHEVTLRAAARGRTPRHAGERALRQRQSRSCTTRRAAGGTAA